MMVRGMLEGNRNYYECWYKNGGWSVWDEVGEEGATLLATMVENLPVVLTARHRGKTYGFVHGGVPSIYQYMDITKIEDWKDALGRDMNRTQIDRLAESLMWDRDMVTCAQEGLKLPKVVGVDYVFHGHSFVPKPLINANRVWIDTGSCFNNNLTFTYFNDEGGLEFYSTLEED